MLHFQNNFKKISSEGKARFQFESELRELGGEEAKKEFNELFDDLVVDACEGMEKYSESVKQVEELLDLERETLIIKRKASAAVITDLFKTGASTLLEETRAVQARKLEAMQRLEGKLRGKLEAAEPM